MTLRVANTALPWANRGGWLDRVELVAMFMGGTAVSLMLSLGSEICYDFVGAQILR